MDAKEKDERDPEGLQGFQEEVMSAETEDGHGASRHAREMNASRVLRVTFSEEIDLIQISRLRGKNSLEESKRIPRHE